LISRLTALSVLVAGLSAALAISCGSPPPLIPTATPFVIDVGPSATPVATPTLDVAPDSPLAPEFTLMSAAGVSVSLADLLRGRDAAVVVFYRGFF
jgi:hypothetical protein